MAAGKPTVTFAPGEHQDWDGAVRVAHSHQDFVKHLETALATDSPELQEKRRAMAEEVRVALIGCGYWGPNLARNFHQLQGCRLVACCDLDPQLLEAMKRLYP